jgi:hypothetical protein
MQQPVCSNTTNMHINSLYILLVNKGAAACNQDRASRSILLTHNSVVPFCHGCAYPASKVCEPARDLLWKLVCGGGPATSMGVHQWCTCQQCYKQQRNPVCSTRWNVPLHNSTKHVLLHINHQVPSILIPPASCVLSQPSTRSMMT